MVGTKPTFESAASADSAARSSGTVRRTSIVRAGLWPELRAGPAHVFQYGVGVRSRACAENVIVETWERGVSRFDRSRAESLLGVRKLRLCGYLPGVSTWVETGASVAGAAAVAVAVVTDCGCGCGRGYGLGSQVWVFRLRLRTGVSGVGAPAVVTDWSLRCGCSGLGPRCGCSELWLELSTVRTTGLRLRSKV